MSTDTWSYTIQSEAAQLPDKTDNFNRANENPLSGGGTWATVTGRSAARVISNQASGTTTNSASIYTGSAYTDDQWAKVTAKSGLEYTGVVLRGATDATTYYVGYGHPTQKYTIQKWVAGSYTQLAVHATQTMVANDVIEFRAVGTALSLLVNGQTILTATDSDISSGYAGIAFYGTTATGDDWESGNIEGTPAGPTITASPLADVIVGTAITPYTYTATGGTTPYTWSVISGSLPPGATLSTAGEYGGTVTSSAGSPYAFTVQVSDNNGLTDNEAVTQTVLPATPGGQYAVTFDYNNLQDTYVNSGADNAVNYSTNDILKLYTCELGTPCNRTIMRWDMSSLPANISITAATLEMYFSQYDPATSGGTASYNAYVYRVTSSPTISTVTWATFDNAVSAYESVTAINQTFGWKSWNVLESAQGAYADGGKILYLALDSGPDHSWSNREFISANNASTSLRPTLSITYTQLVAPEGPSISAPGKMRVVKFIGKFK